MKKISLIFPVYNVAECVKESLLSALEQSYPNIEYLIIDDKGTDNSMEIVNDIIDNHSRKASVRIIEHQRNRGHGGTGNTGIQEATGEYIFFLDSDDILLSNAIDLLVRLLDEDDYDMIAASFERIVNNVKESIYLPDKVLVGQDEILTTYLNKKSCYEMIWGKLYNLSCLKNNNLKFIESCNHEDPPFTFNLMLNLKKVRLSSSIIYQWIFRNGSTTSVYREKNVLDLYLGFNYLTNILQKYSENKNYAIMLSYVNNFRLFPIWLLLKNVVVVSNKKHLLINFTTPLLSFNDILRLPLSYSERVKHIIFLLPQRIKLLVLYLVSYTQKIN